MKYRVEITDTTNAEMEEAWSWLAMRSRRAADRWKAELLGRISSGDCAPGLRNVG